MCNVTLKMQIWEYLTHLCIHWNYKIRISLLMHPYLFVLCTTTIVVQLHKTNSTVISLLDTTFSAFQLLMSKEGLGETMGCAIFCFSFSFCAIIFSIHGWLTQGCDMTKKKYEGIPWYFVLLRLPFPSFCVQSKFWWERKVWFWGVAITLTCSVMDLACLPCTCFDCCWTPTHRGSPGILCLWASQMPYAMGQQWSVNIYVACISACVHVPWAIGFHLQKNSRQQSIKPRVAILSEGSYVTAKVSHSWSQPWLCFE